MNACERRDGRAAIAKLQAGDRSGALVILRRLVSEPSRSPFVPGGHQLVLAFMDFRCERLNGELVQAHVCVARQKASELQRTRDTWRGEASQYPTCVTESCEQGRCIRAVLDPKARNAWQGSGPRGRMMSGRRSAKRGEQAAARQRLERAGVLEPVRTLDIDPDPGEEG